MRREVQTFLYSNPHLLKFVREQPYWYRLLSRNPERVYEIEHESRVFYGQTLPQRVGKFNQNLQMLTMAMNMFMAMQSEK